jgi:hypothetical protein
MTSTMVVTDSQLEALAGKLAAFEDVLDDAEKVALLTVFELAGEALGIRLDDQSDVQGFAMGNVNIGIQVGVPATLPGLGDGLLGSVAEKGKGGGKHHGPRMIAAEYMQIRMCDVIITSIS